MEKPLKCISEEEARETQHIWKKTRALEIEQAQGYVDTREFWYSLDELQEYLKYVQEKSKEQGIDNPGIRIYFGAHRGGETKKSYSTVFLAPTKPILSKEDEENTQENNYSIEPFNHGHGGVPPVDY